MNRMRTLTFTIVTISASTISQLVAAFMVFYSANEIGASRFGLLAIALALAPLTADLVDLGTGIHILRQCATGARRLSSAIRMIQFRLLMGLVPTIGLTVGALLMDRTVLGMFALSCAYGISLSSSLALQGLLRLDGKSATAAISPLIDRGIGIALFSCLHATGKVPVEISLSASLLIGPLAVVSVSTLVLREHRDVANVASGISMRNAITQYKNLYVESRFLGLSGVSSDLNYLETPLVVAVAGSAVGGQFAAGSRILGPLIMPAIVLCQFLLPQVARAHPDMRKGISMLREYAWLFPLYIVALLLLNVFAGFFVERWLGADYGAATVWVIRVTCCSALICFANQFLLMFLQAMHRDRVIGYSMVFSVVIGLCATIAGASLWGAVGAAAGNFISQVLFCAALLTTVWIALRQQATDDIAHVCPRHITAGG